MCEDKSKRSQQQNVASDPHKELSPLWIIIKNSFTAGAVPSLQISGSVGWKLSPSLLRDSLERALKLAWQRLPAFLASFSTLVLRPITAHYRKEFVTLTAIEIQG